MKEQPFRVESGGVLLSVRLTPRAARDGIDGVKDSLTGPYVQVRVRAVPEDGRANAALVELVAAEIGVAKSTLAVVAGHTHRLKKLRISGDAASLESRLVAWLKRFE